MELTNEVIVRLANELGEQLDEFVILFFFRSIRFFEVINKIRSKKHIEKSCFIKDDEKVLEIMMRKWYNWENESEDCLRLAQRLLARVLIKKYALIIKEAA
jgi:hypothetical protein